VECFWEVANPAMLVIDPDTCIDCGLCIPECPVHAIYTEDEVPEPYKEWIKKNKELFKGGTSITEKKGALPGALTLEEMQQKEKAQGWDISEPGGT
jgi:ferredoxin